MTPLLQEFVVRWGCDLSALFPYESSLFTAGDIGSQELKLKLVF